jgi:hypothetical protein
MKLEGAVSFMRGAPCDRTDPAGGRAGPEQGPPGRRRRNEAFDLPEYESSQHSAGNGTHAAKNDDHIGLDHQNKPHLRHHVEDRANQGPGPAGEGCADCKGECRYSVDVDPERLSSTAILTDGADRHADPAPAQDSHEHQDNDRAHQCCSQPVARQQNRTELEHS